MSSNIITTHLFNFVKMNKLNLDILHEIFSYLTPKKQTQIARTCKKFYQIYLIRGDYIINPMKHGFYQYIGHLRIIVFKVKSVKKNYIIFDVGKKRKIQRDDNGIPLCRALSGKGFIFRYDLNKLDKLFKKFCEYCQKFEYCINHFEIVNCNVCVKNYSSKTCKKQKEYFHPHYICELCYKIKYPTMSKKFKELEVFDSSITKFC